MNEHKLKRAEAIQLSKKKEWQRRRHLGLKPKIDRIPELSEKEFALQFPNLPTTVLWQMRALTYKKRRRPLY